MADPIRTAIYRTEDDTPADHRFVGYFYWPDDTVANIVFRGPEPDALREKIVASTEAPTPADGPLEAETGDSGMNPNLRINR